MRKIRLDWKRFVSIRNQSLEFIQKINELGYFLRLNILFNVKDSYIDVFN